MLERVLQWLAAAAVERASAPVVQTLLDAGADVVGIACTDELAYSLAGTNAHTGTPPNPRAPYRISGGSTSGSATAVSLGQASIGLGTDTGGSIRVPAAYQRLPGLRTTHGLLPREGMLALAPSFDTVGWLTRDAGLLAAVGDVLLPPATLRPGSDLVVVDELLALAEPDVAAAAAARVDALDAERGVAREEWDLADHGDWLAAFQTLQAWEAWRERGDWLEGRLDTLGDDVRGRFERAARIGGDEAARARDLVSRARDRIRHHVGDRVLLLPSASSSAPQLGAGLGTRLQQVRDATMRLTCIAGLGGLPALGVPLTTAGDVPCGLCLVATPGRDRDRLAPARELGAHP